MPVIRQPSFSSGEFAPSLWGRTDLPRYAAGARRLFNFFVSRQGAAVSRGGTQFLGTSWGGMSDRNLGKPFDPIVGPPPADFEFAGATIKLVPFKWSDTATSQNYMLEFGDRYFRVWKNGAPIANAYYVVPAYNAGLTYSKGSMVVSGGIWYQSLINANLGFTPASSPSAWLPLDQSTVPNSSPVAATDLYKLKYAQSGDVLTFACAGYTPFTISRVADNQWVPAALDFTRPLALDISGSTLVPQLDLGSLGTADASHPAKQWKYQVTSLRRDQRGLVSESAPVNVTQGIVTGTYSADTTYELGSVVQFSSGDIYFSLQNNNLGHAFTESLWWQFLRTGAPALSTLAQDYAFPIYPDMPASLRFGNTVTSSPDPNFITYRVYRGRSGVFGWVGDSRGPSFVDDGTEPDYSQAPPQGINPFKLYNADGSVQGTETPISVTYFEDRLIFGGTVGFAVPAWGTTIVGGRPMFLLASAVGDYSNFDQRLIATDDQALVFALVSRKRELVRSVVGLNKLFVVTDSSMWAADGSGGPLTPTDIDAHVQVDIGSDWPSPLLIEGAMLWSRNKGTGVRRVAYDNRLAAFSSSDLSMVSDHLLLGHHIVDWCFAEDPWAVAWIVREDGLLLSLTYAPEEQLWAWAQHGVCTTASGAPGVLQSIATIPEGDEDAVYMALTGSAYAGGAAWVLRMGTRQEIDAFDPTLQDPIKVPICLDAWVNAPIIGTSSRTVTVNGLGHLEGRSVWAVADQGNKPHTYTYAGPYTVAGGQITVTLVPFGSIAPSQSAVYVGLPYVPELELLDLAEARSAQKVVNEVSLEAKAVQPFLAGPDFNNLKPPPNLNLNREVDLVRVPSRGTHDTGGRAAVRQVIPAPLTIRAVLRKVSAAQE